MVAFFTGAGSEKRDKQKQHYVRCLPFGQNEENAVPMLFNICIKLLREATFLVCNIHPYNFK